MGQGIVRNRYVVEKSCCAMSEGADLRRTVEVLLERARSGDQAALEELFEVSRPLIGEWATWQVSRTRLGLARPSDIAQDTSIQAYTRFASFEGKTEAEWEAWLRIILRNCTAQAIRAARRKKRDDGVTVPLDDSEVALARSGQPSPSEATAAQEHWRQLMAHIFELPPDQKEAILLVHLKSLPVAEAAKQMDRSEGAVGGLLQRGLKTLREAMADTGEKPDTSLPSAVHQEAAAALLVYLKRCEREGEVDLASFLAEYPACASELRQMIDWTGRIRALRPMSVPR